MYTRLRPPPTWPYATPFRITLPHGDIFWIPVAGAWAPDVLVDGLKRGGAIDDARPTTDPQPPPYVPAPTTTGGTLDPVTLAKIAALPDPITAPMTILAGQTVVHGKRDLSATVDITVPSGANIPALVAAALTAGDLEPEAGGGSGLTPAQLIQLNRDQPLQELTIAAATSLNGNNAIRYRIASNAAHALTITGTAPEIFVDNTSAFALPLSPAAPGFTIPPRTAATLYRTTGGQYLWAA